MGTDAIARPSVPPAATSSREEQLIALFAALAFAPSEHDFFAVLRHVESLRPHLPRIGTALRPSQETIRLGQDPELSFAPTAPRR